MTRLISIISSLCLLFLPSQSFEDIVEVVEHEDCPESLIAVCFRLVAQAQTQDREHLGCNMNIYCKGKRKKEGKKNMVDPLLLYLYVWLLLYIETSRFCSCDVVV